MDSHMTFRVYPNCSYRTHLPGVYCMLGFWSPCTSKFWSQIASSMEVYILNAISGDEVQGAEKKTEKRADVGGFWKILPSEGVCTWKFLSKSYYMRKFCCSEAVTKEVSAWNWAFVSETKTIQWLLTFYVRLFLAPRKKNSEYFSCAVSFSFCIQEEQGPLCFSFSSCFSTVPPHLPLLFFSVLSHCAAQASANCSSCLGLHVMGSQMWYHARHNFWC